MTISWTREYLKFHSSVMSSSSRISWSDPRGQYSVIRQQFGGSIQAPINLTKWSWWTSFIWNNEYLYCGWLFMLKIFQYLLVVWIIWQNILILFYPLQLDQLFSIEINFVFVQFFNGDNGALETKTYFMYWYGIKKAFFVPSLLCPFNKTKKLRAK